MATEKYNLALACDVCKDRNYHFVKGKKRDVKLELNKFCKKCGKMTKHKEVKA